jgi:hypothetical protein
LIHVEHSGRGLCVSSRTRDGYIILLSPLLNMALSLLLDRIRLNKTQTD